MYYRQKHNKKRLWIGLIGFVLFIGVLFFNFIGVPGWVHMSMQSLSRPFLVFRSEALAHSEGFWGGFSSRKSLAEENNNLREELDMLRAHVRRMDSVVAENRQLKSLLGRFEYTDSVMGNVLSALKASPYDTFIIDVGTEEGITVGDQVRTMGDEALGFVNEVTRKSAHVVLYSGAGQEHEARILPNNIPITLRGQGGGVFIFQASQEYLFQKGDVIVLNGQSTIPVGFVIEAEADSNDAFQKVSVRVPTNISVLTRVMVVKSGS